VPFGPEDFRYLNGVTPECDRGWFLCMQHPLVDNPNFEDDKEVYLLPPLKFVGFELWQVKSGTIFDNILVTDDAEYAAKFAEETWGASKDKEKEMLDAVRAEEEKKRKEVRNVHTLACTDLMRSMSCTLGMSCT
jgi:hypothetical protein